MPIKVRDNNIWEQVSSTNGANGANGLDGVVGKVLQVKYRESNAFVTITQQNVYPIFGLGVNIKPTNSTTKLLLEANIVSNAYYVSSFGFALLQGLTYTRIGGNTNTNSTNAISTLFSYGDRFFGNQANAAQTFYDGLGNNMYSVTYRYLYTQPGLAPTGGLTFAPTACSSWPGVTNPAGVINPLTINNRPLVPFHDMISTSSITVTEIEV